MGTESLCMEGKTMSMIKTGLKFIMKTAPWGDRFVILRWILTQKGTKISLAFSKKGFGLKMAYREIWIWFFWMRFHWKQEF